MDSTAPMASLNKTRKAGVVLLSVFAVLAVGLGFLQIRNGIYGPLSAKEVPVAVKDQVNDVENLRYRDTDFDGLNDFDELYAYATSPYLEDTDSDGLSDAQEILTGSNPLCAPGRECVGEALSVAAEGQTRTATTSPLSSLGNSDYDLLQVLGDPAQLRALLVENGMDPTALQGVSDSELLTMVKSMFVGVGQSAETNSADAEPSSPLSSTPVNVSQLPVSIQEALKDPVKARALLAGAGFDKEVLKNISDAQLMDSILNFFGIKQ